MNEIDDHITVLFSGGRPYTSIDGEIARRKKGYEDKEEKEG